MLYICLITVAILAVASSILVLGALVITSQRHGYEENFYRINCDPPPETSEQNDSSPT